MANVERTDDVVMRGLFLMTFLALSYGGLALAQSDFGLVDKKTMIQLEGELLTPRSNVSVYESAPSVIFGNTFNKKVGEIPKGLTVEVIDTKVIPGFGSNQLWVKFSKDPKREVDFCKGKTCWSYYGKLPMQAMAGEAELDSNFQFETEF